jgi:hypothetical protein
MKRTKIKYLRQVILKKPIRERRVPAHGRKALYIIISVVMILLLFVFIFLLFPQTYLDGYIKNRVTDAFAKAYPEYSIRFADVNLNILKNRIEFDSIYMTRLDSAFEGGISSFSIAGINWIKFLGKKKFSYKSFNRVSLDVEGIVLNFNQSQNQIRCGRLQLSVPDSEFVAYAFEYHPSITDEQLFAESKFRNTSYRLYISRIDINGLVYSGLLYGNNYSIHSINIRDALIDILVNMDKPFDTQSPSPLMPGEALNSIKDTICVDSIKVINGSLNYKERYEVGAKPALLTFNNIQAVVYRIANHTRLQDTTVIQAQGNLMNRSNMKLLLSIPTGTPKFSLNYSGSLQEMEVSSLNKFLEISEHQRIKSGLLKYSSFNINVNSGYAAGLVSAEYNDLSIAALDKSTGSEKGVFNRISSFISKTFFLKANNMPDKSGSIRIGVIKYRRKPDDTFFQFVWFALRGGILNVIGF